MILVLNPLLSNISDASTDEVIVEKYLQTRNGRYFDILYKRYSSKVYARSISMLHDENLAQDAVQEVFIKVLMNISKFGGKSKFSSWLYSITYNFCIDQIRKNKKRIVVELEEKFIHLKDEDEIEDKLLLETKFTQLKEILELIPPSDKAILMMKYQDSMSIKSIGDVFEKSDSAVKMQIKRAKQKFIIIKEELYPS